MSKPFVMVEAVKGREVLLLNLQQSVWWVFPTNVALFQVMAGMLGEFDGIGARLSMSLDCTILCK